MALHSGWILVLGVSTHSPNQPSDATSLAWMKNPLKYSPPWIVTANQRNLHFTKRNEMNALKEELRNPDYVSLLVQSVFRNELRRLISVVQEKVAINNNQGQVSTFLSLNTKGQISVGRDFSRKFLNLDNCGRVSQRDLKFTLRNSRANEGCESKQDVKIESKRNRHKID
jgi:hypothetical protein